MAPHADSDKPDVVAPNEPGLDEPSAALQVGKFPKVSLYMSVDCLIC